ncbi:MAG: helix-turn-helix domain-containing protein [Bacteroidota bacterium]
MEPSFDIWTVLFTAAALQGIFLSAVIFARKSRVNNLLASLLLAFSICLLFYVLYWTNYLIYLPFGVRVLSGLTYLMGPLMLFYINSDRKSYFFKPLHFIPAGIYASLFVFTNVWELSPYLEIVQCFHLSVYAIWIIVSVTSQATNSQMNKKLAAWKKRLAWSFLGYATTFLLYYILVWTGLLQLIYDYMISVAATIFIYYIGFEGFKKQDVLPQLENGKYTKTQLTQNAAQSILNKAKEVMMKDQPYLNSDFRLPEFAEKLGVSPNDLSQVLNDLEGTSFTDFVNRYRVEKAKTDLLLFSDKKVIHVAYDCGFNNKVSFNTAFKKFTGSSPSQYRSNSAQLT